MALIQKCASIMNLLIKYVRSQNVFVFILQNIEDSTMRNVIRSVSNETAFKGKDLETVFVVFKVG